MLLDNKVFAAQIVPSWPTSEVKHLGGNSEQTVKHPRQIFSRKHRAHCLNAVPGYWCKIAEHCKQILLL